MTYVGGIMCSDFQLLEIEVEATYCLDDSGMFLR